MGIVGFSSAAEEKVVYSWEFDKPGNAEGWTEINGFGPLVVRDGVLRTTVMGFDPYMYSPGLWIDGQKDKILQIRVKVDKGSGMAVYWTTTTGGWSEDRVFHFDIVADGKWHEYAVDLSVHPEWRKQVTQFRLDLEPPNTEGANLEIDYVRIVRIGAQLALGPICVTRGSLYPGERFEVSSVLSNTGGETVKGCQVKLSLPEGLKLLSGEGKQDLGDLAPGQTSDLKWELAANKAGAFQAGIVVTSGSTQPASRSIPLPVVLAPPVAPSDIPRDVRVLQDESGNLAIENEKVRILFAKSTYGYAELVLYAAKDGKWVRVGSSSPISSVMVLGQDGVPEVLPAYPSKAQIIESGGDRGEVSLVCDARDSSGAAWAFTFTFGLSKGSSRLATEYAATVDRPAKVLRFAGPTLKVGEGSFGKDKDSALFPGLEWLVGDEVSSSTLDAKPPYNLRVVPNPLKVTVPLMAVLHDGVLVSLMWDPRQKWDNEHDLVNAEFASPNWFQGQDNHLMGLFVPTTPEWVEENQDQAARPYELGAGGSLKLAAQIVVDRADDILASLDQWYAAYGFPEPEAAPRTWDEEKALITHAYMESYWKPDAKGWGHVYGWAPEPFPMALALLDMLALRNSDAAMREKIRDRVKEVVTHMVLTRDLGYVGSGAGAHIPLRLLPFYEGWLEQAVKGWKGEASGLLASQQPDGSWRFNPGGDANRRQLGEAGAEAIGLTAGPAWTLLRIARLTGDTEFQEAGLRALEYMRKFRVPRAAQVWEVPVHTPDILAAGKAVAAYVEGYRLTGNEEYLDLARYWAKTGLPFLYSWGLPDRPMMKYGSIPVFGATFFTLPWFARIVQWNGVVYAYHLLELAELDDSFPWRKVAEGLVISAMHQQRTSEPAKGGYPDVWELIPNRPILNVDINPEGIAKPAFYLFEGRSPDIKTALVKDGTKTIHVSSVAEIEEARMAGSSLSFRLAFFEGATSYCLVAGVEEPRAVYVNGKELSYQIWLEREVEGWKYTVDGYLIIKLRHAKDTEVKVE